MISTLVPILKGSNQQTKLLSQTWSCHRKKKIGHLTKPTNVVLFSSLPMAVDCRWRSLLHELTQATMMTGRRSFFWSWGYVVFFFTLTFWRSSFWDRNSSSCIFGFSGWWWSQLCFLCVYFFKIFHLYLRKGFNLTTDWYFSIGWLNHRLVGPSLDVTVGFDDWLFGSRVCNPLRPTRGLPIVC